MGWAEMALRSPSRWQPQGWISLWRWRRRVCMELVHRFGHRLEGRLQRRQSRVDDQRSQGERPKENGRGMVPLIHTCANKCRTIFLTISIFLQRVPLFFFFGINFDGFLPVGILVGVHAFLLFFFVFL